MKKVNFISLKNVIYDLGDGNKLKIIPIAPTNKNSYQDEMFFNHEKFVIDEYAKFFDNYKESLAKLT